MNYKIIDAHSHLWLKQDSVVNGKAIHGMANGRCMFMGEEKQMLPPYILDGRNTAEIFLSCMDYAQVSAAVVTQEFIDGLQNDYLEEVGLKYPNRFFVCGMPETRKPGFLAEAKSLMDKGFKSLKVPAARLIGDDWRVYLTNDEMMTMFKEMEKRGVILSIELFDGAEQVPEMEEVLKECPDLKVVLGHFAMVTRPDWEVQMKLARHKNVFVESGGITWLFNDEFYPFPSAMKAIRQAADWVGIDKLMWGSDYPRTIVAITYKMSYDFVVKSSELTEEEKIAFLGGNARKLYGFTELADLPYIKNMSED